MMRKRMLTGPIFLLMLVFASPLWAQSTVQYVYDALGRLTTVVDPSGNVATYNYDAVGNFLSITRTTTSPTALAIFGFSPSQGSVGQTVVIQGQNFSPTPSANTVQFNGTAAPVSAATANSLTVTVPAGAATGVISVTVGTATANSSSTFTVLAIPAINSINPTLTVQTPTISSFQVTGSNLTGATFSFAPSFTPPAITISNVIITGNGTSATMTLALASNAAGSFALVATNGSGSTPATPAANNTLTILSSDPSADFDGDGLTNIYEAAIATSYANFSTPNDGLPDGWALFFTSPPTPPLNASLAGQTGANGLTYLHSFQSGLNPLLNTVAPQVSTIYPANTATNYPTNGVVVVRFTEKLMAPVSLSAAQSAINTALPTGSNFSTANASAAAQVLQAYLLRTCCGTAAAPGAVQVTQNGQPVPGAVYLSNDQLSLTFAPKFFSASTTFTVTVQGVRDAGGNVMTQPFTSTFKTGLGAAENSPSVLATTPPNNATGVEINTPFRVEFSRPVNPSTLTLQSPQNFSVVDAFTGQTVPGMIQVDPFLLSASFVPAQPYGVGRTIIVSLTAGITDVTGVSFPANTYIFTTGFVGDSQGPTLMATSPSDTATAVPLNAKVVLEFNEPMDAVSALTGLQIQLAGVTVPGAIALSDGNKRITFSPTSALTANSTYTIATTPQLLDFAGNPLSNPDISTFTAGTTSDTTAPQVTFVNPQNNAMNVPTNVVIQAQFSKAIDPITLTNATFSVYSTDVNPNEQVAGAISVSTDGKTATFTPSAPLAASTYFTLSLTNGIADMEGNALVASLTNFTTGLGTVTTRPTVVVSPPNGATGVMVNAHTDVMSSAPISKTSAWSSAIQLSAGGVNVSGNTTLSPDQTTLTFVPSSNLAVSTTYTLTVSGFTDQAGNVVQTSTTTFTTGTSGTSDTSVPSVLTVVPAQGATGIAVTSSVVLTFNKNIDPNSVNDLSIPVYLTAGPTRVLAGSYVVSGSTVTFTPTTQLPGSTTIQVAVGSSGHFVYDFAGNLNNSFSSSFTTAAVTDTTAPQVVSVTPGNGATGIGLDATIVLTFSKSLNPNTVSLNNIGLLANGSKLGGITLSISADNRVVSLKTAGLLPASSTVNVVATSAVQDLSGNALTNFTSQFTTAAAFDTAHPTVVTQRPGNAATGVPVNTSVVLYVNEQMNTATVSGALHISQNGVLVAGTTQVTDNGQTIQFTPSLPFQNSATIQVFLDSTALDTDGNSFTSYAASFTTVANLSASAPLVVSTNPANQAPGVPTNITTIDIGFNQALNPATVNTTTVTLLKSGTAVARTVNLLSGGTTIEITPSATLLANTSYTFQVSTGVQGTNGLAITAQTFSFVTATGTDTNAPTVITVAPQNGLGNVGNNALVRVVFSKSLNPLTVSAITIQLTGGGTTAVADSINFSNNNATVVLTPHAPLPDATLMSLTMSGVKDITGNVVTTQTTQFTTGTGPDVLIPLVVAQNPYSQESSVPLNGPIQLRVNEPVDPGTVNSSSFLVVDTTANQTVTGSYSVSADGQTISFVPNPLLTAVHGITVGSGHRGITDLVGNLLATSTGLSDFTFTTGTTSNTTAPQVVGISPPNALTGVPINAQVAIQFNEPVDALTVNQVTLGSGGTVNVNRTLVNGNQTLILVPVLPLSPSTAYTVTITGIQDIGGNSMGAQVTQTFTTGLGADLTPPTVSSVSPANNATGVLRNSVIQLHFNKRIDPFMVTNSTFTVSLSNTPIAGNIVVSADGLTATFTPTATLAASTTYQISATIGITDLEGQPLTPSFLSSFTTGTQ
jgi:YD repeat-containing protein